MSDNNQNNLNIIEKIIRTGIKSFSPENIIKKINFKKFKLEKFNNIYLIGFGKGSSALAKEIKSKVKIKKELIIDVENFGNNPKSTTIGTHPLPSKKNILATKKIIDICEHAKENDLIITLVCGGGSALLTDPINPLKNTQNIYYKLINSGATIKEINIVRAHLDQIKGGGLAKISYPANIISFIVSDVPNNNLETIASGPTVINNTTVDDAKLILNYYKINFKNIKFQETIKDSKIFSKTNNYIIADNKLLMEKISEVANKFNFNIIIGKNNLNESPENTIKYLVRTCTDNSILLAAGEAKFKVNKNHGIGGRNTHMAALALKYLKPGMIFASIASDGHDNSDAAGAIVDYETIVKCKNMKINIDKYINNFDTFNLFKKSGNLLFTGKLPINVSDLYLVLKK